MTLSAVHYENLDRPSWKSRVFNMKISTVRNKIFTAWSKVSTARNEISAIRY